MKFFSTPLVSIIIPVYNAEKFLEEALDSCLQQTYEPIEVIAVDNNSSDRSLEILERYVHQFSEKIKVFSEKEPGAPAARNKGMKEAAGDYIHFLDADDALNLNAVEVLMAEMTPGFDAVSGGETYYRNHLENIPLFERKRIKNVDYQLSDVLYNHPNTGAILLKKTVLKNVKWDKDLGAAQELVFWSELILKNNAVIKYVPVNVCKIRIHQSPHRISNQEKNIQANNKYLAILKIEQLINVSPYSSPMVEIALNDFKLKHAFKAIHARNFRVSYLLSSRINKNLLRKSKNFRWLSKEGITSVSNLYFGFLFYFLSYKMRDRLRFPSV